MGEGVRGKKHDFLKYQIIGDNVDYFFVASKFQGKNFSVKKRKKKHVRMKLLKV
jgi:hypothetical protein